MWELCLGVMATASCIINYHDLGYRNVDADGNKISSTNHSCVFLNSLVLRLGNKTAIRLVGLLWLIAYGYHYTIAVLFPLSVILNMLNIMVAILISVRFCRLLYRLTLKEEEGGPLFHSDLLTTTACMWEIILACVVLAHLMLYYF